MQSYLFILYTLFFNDTINDASSSASVTTSGGIATVVGGASAGIISVPAQLTAGNTLVLTFDSTAGSSPYSNTPSFTWSRWSPLGNFDNLNLTWDDNANSYSNMKIRVAHATWKSLTKIGTLFYIDDNGEMQQEFVSEYYKLNPDYDLKIEWEWIHNVEEGYKI